MPVAIRLLIVALAIAGALVPIPAAWVERAYSSGVFPFVQAIVTRISNLARFSLFDALVIVAALWWTVGGIRDIARRGDSYRRPRARPFLSIAGRTLTLAAAAYLAFILLWGLNYRRVPLIEKMAFDRERVTTDAASALMVRTVDRLNELYEDAHRHVWTATRRTDPALAAAFATARPLVGASARTVPGRPKATLFDWYFRRASIAGMTDPYFLETLVASDLLLVERPYVEAHEWGHLAGFADESEASFVGWVTCLHGNAFHQYSAWLFLYQELAADLPRSAFQRAASRLGEGPRIDLEAIRARREANVSPEVSAASWRVYDQYLKANRVEEGTASYGEVVTLILGTRQQGTW
jgi:hypothetical protein